MSVDLSNNKNVKKLARDDALKFISNLDSQDDSTKKLLKELLDNELIELYSNLDNPDDIKVGLTKRGFKALSNTSQL